MTVCTSFVLLVFHNGMSSIGMLWSSAPYQGGQTNYRRGSQNFSCLIEHYLIKTVVKSTRSEQQTSQSVISTLNLNHKQLASSRVTLNSGYTGSVSVRHCLHGIHKAVLYRSNANCAQCRLHTETLIVNVRAKVRWNATADGYGYKITFHLEFGTSNQLSKQSLRRCNSLFI